MNTHSQSRNHTLLPAYLPESHNKKRFYYRPGLPRWTFRSGSVFWTVWPSVLGHAVFSTFVAALTLLTSFELAIPNVMLTVLGVVLGFVISYRALSGYDRYFTGRTAWADIMKTSRIMGRLIWFHVPPCRTPRTEEERQSGTFKRPKEELAKIMAEKRIALDLIEGFAIALKHHIRGEPGIYYDDLYNLVKPLHPESLSANGSHFDTVAHTSQQDLFAISPVVEQDTRTLPSTTSTITSAEEYRTFGPPKPQWHSHKNRPSLRGKANLPLEVLRCLSEWLSVLEDRGTVPGTSMGALMGCIATFEDQQCIVEKVVSVPLPFVLNVHIRHTVWVYLFFLPFQLVEMFGWYSIVGVIFASFIYCGFVAAGEELEQPFGYDANDLDLDLFCKEIIRPEMSRLKRTSCLNAWFSRRWKEKILKEQEKRNKWIRKGIVTMEEEYGAVNGGDTRQQETAESDAGKQTAQTSHHHHVARPRSKTITATFGKEDAGSGKGKTSTGSTSESSDVADDDVSSQDSEEDESNMASAALGART